jgi:hypothetical protein
MRISRAGIDATARASATPPDESSGAIAGRRDADDGAATLDHSGDGVVSSGTPTILDPRRVETRHHGPPSSPLSVASIAASFARSASESFASAAASSASPGAAPAPSPSVPCPAASGATPFAFSDSLVQTLVQTGEDVGVSPLLLSLTTGALLLPKLDVAGSNPVSRS